MIVHRVVFQAKFGKAGELVALFKAQAAAQNNTRSGRILTDFSGPFDTVVLELEYESMAELEAARAAMFADPNWTSGSAMVEALVESGHNEYYTLEVSTD